MASLLLIALLGLSCRATLPVDEMLPRLLWADPKASPTATFQSHADKLLLDGSSLQLAYSYHRAGGGSSNRVVAIDLITGAVAGHANLSDSNSGCLARVAGRTLHVYEDYLKNELLIDRLDGSDIHVVPRVHTAGKISCASDDDRLYIATTYGSVYSLQFDHPGPPRVQVLRGDFELLAPEFAQYPHLVVVPSGLLVFNNTVRGTWHYQDLLVSRCTPGGCNDAERVLPADVAAANSWVGDVLASDDEGLVVFFSTNEFDDSADFFQNPRSNVAHVGWSERGRWHSARIGPRMLSGRLLRVAGELLLVTTTVDGRITVHAVHDRNVEQVAAYDLDLDCAYALDATSGNGGLFVAVTDRGPGCRAKDNLGMAQMWSLPLL